MENKIVTIDLDKRSYDIFIGSGLLQRLADFIPYDLEGRQIFIVYDQNVEDYARTIEKLIKGSGIKAARLFALEPGEHSKSFDNVQVITSWMLDHKISRKSLVMAVGGGVTGDLTGFCASIALRGVPYIQIPTTLLSQVDSSVGGKTGINTGQGKNLIGSFYQPGGVVIDVDTLKTLPRREMLAGYAEVVKYALINDSGFFNWLEENGQAVCAGHYDELVYAIETSVRAKAEIVEADEKEEGGRRALLNLGHTFAHALEAAAKYDGRLLHGEAVAIGILMAFELSCRMGLCLREDVDRTRQHFEKCGLPLTAAGLSPSLNISVDDFYNLMRGDKKADEGKINFILVNGIGEAFISDAATETMVKDVVRDFIDSVPTSQKGGGSTSEAKPAAEFKRRGVKGLWKSAFSSQS